MKRPTLALAMIVKNEAENLPRLFESIKGCFDEIHITDTGSIDNTVEIAKSLGATVHHFDWVNDFSAARNASFDVVQTDYIMWMDGDDVLEDAGKFCLWRDNVMGLADYHMAPYHYSSDASGKAVCTSIRERVIKNHKGMRWKYFVHEGVLPMSPIGPIRTNMANTWAIRHMRTAEDLIKDHSRNLNLFEKHLETLDPRMKYYYGKELFEAGKIKESKEILLQALAEPLLEMHDRILGFQYVCYALIRLEEYPLAIDLAHAALQIAPQRAEFHTTIGDCYLKLGRIQDSVPYFEAAKGCQSTQAQGQPGAIFVHEDSYSLYPRNQLARVFANMGDLARGEKEALETLKKHPTSDETKSILAEIQKITHIVQGYQNAKPCEDIVFSCPPVTAYPFDPEIAKQKAMGGSETALIEMAQFIHKISGRPVKVFNMRETDGTFDGVQYLSTSKLNEYMAINQPYLHIAWRHNIKLTDAPTFVWSHDLQTLGVEAIQNFNQVMCLTPFHKRFMMATQGVPEHKIYVTRNGIKPERFKDTSSITKNPNKFVFPSSPDRGLDRAMRVLDRVRETHPDVELHVFYGIEHLHKYGLKDLADRLKVMMDERPWVKYHGATQQDELIRHFKEAAIWLHPCDFIETSCITAMEMVCSGVYPVTRRLGGLMDTLADAESKGMATLIDSDCITELEYELYIQATRRALDEKAWERVKMDPEAISWESVAKEWLRDLPTLAQGGALGLTG